MFVFVYRGNLSKSIVDRLLIGVIWVCCFDGAPTETDTFCLSVWQDIYLLPKILPDVSDPQIATDTVVTHTPWVA